MNRRVEAFRIGFEGKRRKRKKNPQTARTGQPVDEGLLQIATQKRKKRIRHPQAPMQITILDSTPTTAFGHIQTQLVNG